ncbi:hypothetical protein Q7P36_002425 [Cladosporium allicinum]
MFAAWESALSTFSPDTCRVHPLLFFCGYVRQPFLHQPFLHQPFLRRFAYDEPDFHDISAYPAACRPASLESGSKAQCPLSKSRLFGGAHATDPLLVSPSAYASDFSAKWSRLLPEDRRW